MAARSEGDGSGWTARSVANRSGYSVSAATVPGMPPVPAERRVRSDAQRNRAALVAAATAAFRDEGLDVAVDEIARRAGVGVATLYRHFPAKTDLILAVMHDVIDELAAAVETAMAAPDPADVLPLLLGLAAAGRQRNRGFLEAIAQDGLEHDAREALARRIVTLLEPAAARAHEAGTLRRELDAHDLLAAMRMLGAATTTALDPRPAEH